MDKNKRREKGIMPKAFMAEILRFTAAPVMKSLYKFRFDKTTSAGIKPPCIIIANHTTTLDPFLTGDGFDFALSYVASDSLGQHKILAKMMKACVGMIFKSKSMADLTTIRAILTVLRKGGGVCFFPEGNRTLNGETAEVPGGIERLCKKAGVPVVIVRFRRGYLTKPRWGKRVRKGRMTAAVHEVITPERLAEMSEPEIYEAVKSALYYNVYDDQDAEPVAFKDRKRAESINQALFVCPDCGGIGTIYSKGIHFGCKKCGLKYEYTETGYLKKIEGKTEFLKMTEWDAFQRGVVKNTDMSKHITKPVCFADGVIFYDCSEHLQRVTVSKSGVLYVVKDAVVYKYSDKSGSHIVRFPAADIFSATITGRKKLQIYGGGKSCLFKLKERDCAYMFTAFIYKTIFDYKREEMSYYGI